MRVILEGPDNAGKTSLAKTVRGAVADEIVYFHPGGPPTDAMHEARCVGEQLWQLSSHERIIMDRVTPISQMVYNPDRALDMMRQSLLQAYWDTGAVLIYCRPTTDRLLRVQDLTWRGDESEEHKQKIIVNQHKFVQRYDEIMRTIPCICYDFEDRPMAGVIVGKMINAMRGSVEDAQWFRTLLSYRG